MRKVKYHVVIDFDGDAIIDITSKEKSVEDWVNAFQKKGKPGSSLKVYKVTPREKTCALIYEESYAKPIGFGNW